MIPSNNARFAIAARLHTLLRRKTGRVTDIDWLAVNDEYANEIVNFARTHTTAPDMEDLAEWADRLEQVVRATTVKTPQPPALAKIAPIIEDNQPLKTPNSSHSTATWAKSVLSNVHKKPTFNQDDTNAERYVGGLR